MRMLLVPLILALLFSVLAFVVALVRGESRAMRRGTLGLLSGLGSVSLLAYAFLGATARHGGASDALLLSLLALAGVLGIGGLGLSAMALLTPKPGPSASD